MRELRQLALRLVRRMRRRNEMDRVEMEPPLRGLRYGDVARVHGIERPTEKRHRAVMPRARRFMSRLRDQCFSVCGAAAVASSTCVTSTALLSGISPSLEASNAAAGFGILSSALAIARTSSTMPSPLAEEIA